MWSKEREIYIHPGLSLQENDRRKNYVYNSNISPFQVFKKYTQDFISPLGTDFLNGYNSTSTAFPERGSCLFASSMLSFPKSH